VDPRYQQLSEVIAGHSIKVTPGDNVLIEAYEIPEAFVIALIREVRKLGGRPMVDLKNQRILRELVHGADQENMALIGACERFRMEQVQCYVGIRGNHNISEMSDVPGEKMKQFQSAWYKPVHFEWRVPKTRWVVMRWPHASMAQQAGMSTEAFEKFYFDVVMVDYPGMAKAQQPLVERMTETKLVEISGPGTDLRFSMEGIPVVPCSGEANLPDGECFSCPVKDSVEGVIQFNTPTIYLGTTFKDIRLVFEKGKIIEATADKTEKLNEILDTDEGARYIGEFSLAFNPVIQEPMLDILFDEKIAGSFHFTPGNAYDDADNGNRSEVHWDMVMIQRPEYGGGEIRFDGELIRKDGLFVVDALKGLNPENLAL